LTQNPGKLVDFKIQTQSRKFLAAPDMSRPGVFPCHVAARKLQQIAADSTTNCRFYRPHPATSQATSQATGHHASSRPRQRTTSARPPAADRRPAESAGHQQGRKYGHHGTNGSAQVHHHQQQAERHQRPDLTGAQQHTARPGKAER
jgi:hypothetical protein